MFGLLHLEQEIEGSEHAGKAIVPDTVADEVVGLRSTCRSCSFVVVDTRAGELLFDGPFRDLNDSRGFAGLVP